MTAQLSVPSRVALIAIASVVSLKAHGQAESAPQNKGAVEKIEVHGKALEANLEGDSPDRDVFVYLPPSYGKQTGRHYPVVDLLHGTLWARKPTGE